MPLPPRKEPITLMGWCTRIQHLSQINSVDWWALASRAWRVYPDYRRGDGVSNALLNITLEVSYRCQWRCDFCFLKDNVLNREVDELSFAEIERLIDCVAPHRVGFFITGGEPFIRADCIDIIRAIKARGLKVGVNTNHTLLNEEKIDALIEAGLDYLISSLHGPQEIHDAVTGTKTYEKVMQRLRYWRTHKRHTRILINSVMAPQVLPHMGHLVEAAAEAGVDAITFQHESFLTRLEREKHEACWREIFQRENEVELSHLEFDPAQHDGGRVRAAIDTARARARELKVHMVVKPDLSDAEIDTWYADDFRMPVRCSYLYTDMRINPSGDLVACQPLPKVIGNIREQNPLELFNSAEYRTFRQGIQAAGGLYPGCARCCKLHRRF